MNKAITIMLAVLAAFAGFSEDVKTNSAGNVYARFGSLGRNSFVVTDVAEGLPLSGGDMMGPLNMGFNPITFNGSTNSSEWALWDMLRVWPTGAEGPVLLPFVITNAITRGIDGVLSGARPFTAFNVMLPLGAGMTNPLQNFWVNGTNLHDWVQILAPVPDPSAPLAVYYPEGNVTDFSQITTDGLTYSLNEDGTATVTGYSGSATDIVLPWETEIDGVKRRVTAVGGRWYNIDGTEGTSLIAPTTVTRIESEAFSDCFYLTSVSLPSATSIGENAFSSCSYLTSVSLPSATSIGRRAFAHCSSLTSVSLPSATSIEENAFFYCGLTSVSLPSVTNIEEYAFSYCNLTRVSLPSVTRIGYMAFAFSSSLTSVSLPSVTHIGDMAFYFCPSLTSVDFGATPRDAVFDITPDVYTDVPTSCKFIIPLGMYDEWITADGWRDLYAAGYKFMGYADVKSISNAPTIDSDSLAIYYPEGNVTDFSQITTDGLTYSLNEDGSATVTGYSGSATDIVLPWETEIDGVKRRISAVGNRAFAGLQVTSLIAPTTVTRVESEAFSECFDLTSVSFPSATSIGENAFSSCSSLTSVSLPSATSIGDEAFTYCGMSSISFPSATSLGENAFSSCFYLTSVSLPSATSIGRRAFMDCNSLARVSLPLAASIGGSAFAYCSSLTSVSLPSVTSIEREAFSDCSSLTSVSLPSVTSIGGYAFSDCSALKSVDFGATPRDVVPALASDVYSDVPTSCKIIVPLGMYDEWIAAPGWSDLYAAGYNFMGYANAAAMSADNPAFSNAVLTVGLGIDTNVVAAINALVEEGDELPIGGATSVGALLLALAAAVAALRKKLSYTIHELGASTTLVDRAVNVATISTTMRYTLPAPTTSGVARDLVVNVTTSNSASVDFANADAAGNAITYVSDDWPAVAAEDGENVWALTETATNRFLVKRLLVAEDTTETT